VWHLRSSVDAGLFWIQKAGYLGFGKSETLPRSRVLTSYEVQCFRSVRARDREF
jgi:hypothetical protein